MLYYWKLKIHLSPPFWDIFIHCNSQPIPMKFGFSIENTSGQCKLKSILQKSHSGGPKTPNFFRFGELEIGELSWVYLSTNTYEIWFQHRKYLGTVQVEVHFAKIAFWGVQGSKNSEIFTVFGELEIGKLSWVYFSTNANAIWFQHRKSLGPVQVEVHFAKIVFWGSRGPQRPKF